MLAVGLFVAGVALHLLFLLSLRFGWLNPFFNDTMHRFGPGGDFFSIYAAGVKARLGESVYTIGGHVQTVPYAYAFRYAPLVAYTLGAGLSLLPAITSYSLWLIVCEMTLLRNVRLTLELAQDRQTGYIAAALWLLFSPYFLELFVGQFTFLTASLVFWAYLGWQDKMNGKDKAPGKQRVADWLWAGAVWLKMMPLLYLPVVLLRGRWKSALAVLLVLGASSALYFAAFPHDWATFAATNGDAKPAGHAGNLGLMALLYHASGERMGPFRLARIAVLIATGLSLAWLTYRTWTVHPKPEPRQQRIIKQNIKQNTKGGRRPGSRQKREGTQRTDQSVSAQDVSVQDDSKEKARRVAHEWDDRLLVLYAACSAAYLLTYKDVWEHHYVLLLPPIVLLTLRKASPWLWLPPFLISALPGLFVLYDLPGLGYNEDPQVYWRPATSLLHHAGKPLAPLWLLGGLLAQSVIRPHWKIARPKGQRLLQAGAACALCLAIVTSTLWARTVIAQQREVTQELVWSPHVFQKQQQVQTCGPAALAAVCRHFGIPATEAEIARLAGTTTQGTSMLGLQAAARAKGLSAEGVQTPLASLSKTPCPCILFFHPGHFAVLTGMRGQQCYLADPSLGQRMVPEDQLAQIWHGELLIVGPTVGSHASMSAP